MKEYKGKVTNYRLVVIHRSEIISQVQCALIVSIYDPFYS